MTLNIENHPCFNASARHDCGRVHLPVAPACNIQCNFCNRKYDCANESRPGVTSTILSPGQAMYYLEQVVRQDPRITVVGIAGPGDPFANPGPTMETLRRVRERFPKMLLCVASNGLNVAPYAQDMADLAVSHVTITMNAIDPEVGAKVYGWVRDDKRMLRGVEAAERLISRQLEAIRVLKEKGLVVKVNTIIVPGVNDAHAIEVAKTAGLLGVDILNCLPLYPVEGSAFEHLPEPRKSDMGRLRVAASEFVPQMLHCGRCRADAAGLLSEGIPGTIDFLSRCAQLPLEPDDNKNRVAVATLEGVLVNQHLGEASKLSVFEREGDGFRLVEERETPPAGLGEQRWQALGEAFNDCATILVSGAGRRPTDALARNGIRLVTTEGAIDMLLESHLEGLPLPPPSQPMACGAGCTGNGTGCG